MGTKKGTRTEIIVAGFNVSVFVTDSNIKRTSGSEDLTTYGKDSEVYGGTLLAGEFGCSGKYDDTAAGPRAVLKPLVGSVVTIQYRPEGTGSGLPQDEFDALITGYEETAPVAGYRLWTLETQPSDDWNSADQV